MCRTPSKGPRLVASVLAAMACALPSTAGAQTLSDTLARVYQANPQLNADRARQRSDDENVPRALAGFLPSVSATIEYGPTYQRSRPGGGSSLAQPITPGLAVSQNVYDSGRTVNAVRSAESDVFSGRATLRGTEQTVLLSAVSAYMGVLRDAALVELQANNAKALTETLRIARARYLSGDTRRTDAAQAEARLARGEADLATARSNLVTSQAAFRQVVGVPPASLVFPRPIDDRLPGTLKAAVAIAREQHPAIRAALHAVDMAQSDVGVAAADLGPSLRIQGSLSRTFGASPDDSTTSSPVSLGPQLTIPIYDGGLASAQVRQAKEVAGQRRVELEGARADVMAMLRSAWGALDAARAAVPAAETAVSANEIALAGVQRENLEGQRTTLDVLNAQQELLASRTNLIVAQRDHVVASYATLAALGSLTAARLGLRTPIYRAGTHYEQVRALKAGLRTPDGR